MKLGKGEPQSWNTCITFSRQLITIIVTSGVRGEGGAAAHPQFENFGATLFSGQAQVAQKSW